MVLGTHLERGELVEIAVVGAGYVGLSVALLLARHHTVRVTDTNPARVEAVNAGSPYLSDAEMSNYLARHNELGLSISATTDPAEASRDAQYAIIAVPTNYDPENHRFDTKAVESAIDEIRAVNDRAWIVIRSTVPIGYTEAISAQRNDPHILVSPEFLREGHALFDNLHPSRVVVGTAAPNAEAHEAARIFAQLLADDTDLAASGNLTVEAASTAASHEPDAAGENRPPETNTDRPANENNPASASRPADDALRALMICTSREAEAIKLFSNTYLALRVSFFNELDTFCMVKGIDAGRVIRGVTADARIGDYYDNPSFGYGGYCLPKDTKQLLSNYRDVPQDLIGAVVASNQTRKQFIVNEVCKRIERLHGAQKAASQPPTPSRTSNIIVGIYRLTMKKDSDNFRESSIIDIIAGLCERGVRIHIYEPMVDTECFMGCPVTHDLASFKRSCAIILANRWSDELADCRDKVYSRDLLHRD